MSEVLASVSDHRAGFVALIGRPNAGKSTLLNRLLGQKVAITSSKPQTTRNRIAGILTGPDMQAILLDTPGLHKPKGRLNRALVRAAEAAVEEVDAVCWVVDLTRFQGFDPAHEAIARLVDAAGKPVAVALNKLDKVARPSALPRIALFAERLSGAEVVPISARTGENVDALVGVWHTQLPPGPPLYPPDQIADVSLRFLVAEVIREKVFRFTRQEIPYATAVQIERFDERDDKVDIYARILVQRDSQKGIVIGRGGQMLKRIGTEARREIAELLGARVYLELFVGVQKDWTENPRILRELGIE